MKVTADEIRLKLIRERLGAKATQLEIMAVFKQEVGRMPTFFEQRVLRD